LRSAHELLDDFRETHLALDQGRTATPIATLVALSRCADVYGGDDSDDETDVQNDNKPPVAPE